LVVLRQPYNIEQFRVVSAQHLPFTDITIRIAVAGQFRRWGKRESASDREVVGGFVFVLLVSEYGQFGGVGLGMDVFWRFGWALNFECVED
jgi:hypothetical protein